MAKQETVVKPLWKTCKHENAEEGALLAVNGDTLAFLACWECGTILEWKRVKKGKPEQAEIEKPATEAKKPAKPKPKPKAKVEEEDPQWVTEEFNKVKAEEAAIVKSSGFKLKDIKANGDSVIFTVDFSKGKTFEVTKDSTEEKALAVEEAKDKYIDKTAIIASYSEVDDDNLPVDPVFEQMVKITEK